jgi:hypothetical protein
VSAAIGAARHGPTSRHDTVAYAKARRNIRAANGNPVSQFPHKDRGSAPVSEYPHHDRTGVPVETTSFAIARVAMVAGLAAVLAGCATSSAFVDPAKYDLYNCKQLGAARRTADSRVVELEGLMAKAETGAGGALVSGLAYQTEYLTARGQRDLIDERIASNHCTSADLAAPPPEPAATPPVVGRKARR